MNDTKHLNFIDDLANKLKPVNVNWSAEKRTCFWFIIHCTWMALLMFAIKPFRYPLVHESHVFQFVFEATLFLVGLVFTGYFCFLSFVPGAIKSNKIKLSLIPVLFLIILFLYKIIFPSNTYSNWGWVENYITMRSFCEFEIMLYSLIPLAHIYYLIKKSIFINNKWTFICAVLSSSLIPAFIMHFACAYNYTHILIFHIGTTILMTLVATPVLFKIYKKSQ